MNRQIRASNADVKRLNRNRVFRYIGSHQRLSRPEIAAALGLSGPTVLQIANELLEEGLIQEVGELKSTGGRKAKALSPIHGARCAVGLDLTQNHIGLVLTDLSGELLRHRRIQKGFSLDPCYFGEVSGILAGFLEEVGVVAETILGVGVSVPGIVNPEKREIVSAHPLGIYHVPCEEISRYIPYPCAFANDASAAGIAELGGLSCGSHAVYLSLSNSVGGAVISRWTPSLGGSETGDLPVQSNQLYPGDTFRSGEIGHMTLIPGGEACYCGQRGCFDAYCNARVLSCHTGGSLDRFFRELPGSDHLRRVWETYLDHLAVQINSIRMMMDCDIIVGGYVGSAVEPYLGELRQRLKQRNTFGDSCDYLHACRYRVEASALGAALLHIEAYINTI